MVEVIEHLTENNWDHIFVINAEGAPQGRIHAVDVLKNHRSKNSQPRYSVDARNSSSTTGQSAPNYRLQEPTPLLKAGALMLAHDLNQIGVVDRNGALIGVVGHNTMARKMPKFIL